VNNVKEITVFTVGDANQIRTWSNVPYFFTKSLEEKGVKINRVNIEENKLFSLLYKYSVYAILKIIYPNSNHNYFRSGLNYFLTNRKIKRATKTYSTSDLFLSLTYSFHIYPGVKTALFSDWSYSYYIENFLKRKPYWFEKKALQRETKHINEADLVLSLFPRSFEFLKRNSQNKNIFYLGNVINANHKVDKEKLFASKIKSNVVLFIGNKKYLKGAQELADTFLKLNNDQKDAVLHLIGLDKEDIGVSSPKIICHGYLDKGVDSQNNEYYELLSKAKVIVNSNPGWGAFSAMTEAMYYYTPVITTRYEEFTETYGNEISFGYYVKSDSSDELRTALEKIFSCTDDEYIQMMNNAHEQVKEFTWENYSDKFLKLLGS
jgi:glycosyltransferase involved in cell wall biosynthesis